ncbi:molybdopterin-dependent oxidoreductase, partial [Methylobacterium trifolii]
MAVLMQRRRFLTLGAGLAGTAMLGGCDRFAGTDAGRRTLRLGEDANLFVQRLLLSPASLAREFSDSQISPWFKPNGTIDPPDRAYKALAAKGFSAFKLEVGGLVERPLSLTLADLRGLPVRTQTTRHDCVEGWSCIGKWAGVPLAELLTRAGLKPQARYVVFHCADTLEYAGGGLEGSGNGASLLPRVRPETPSAVRLVAAAG